MFSCSENKTLEAEEFVKWVDNEKNGLVKTKVLGDFIFELKYRPIQYEIALNKMMKLETNPTSNDDGFYLFTLKIREKNSMDITEMNANGDFNAIQKNIYFLSYSMQNHIQLKDGESLIPCEYYVFERSFDLSSTMVFNIGFEVSNQSNEDKTIIIGGSYFDLPPIKINFLKSDLMNIPQLKLN
jgi:hypothetical protein